MNNKNVSAKTMYKYTYKNKIKETTLREKCKEFESGKKMMIIRWDCSNSVGNDPWYLDSAKS